MNSQVHTEAMTATQRKSLAYQLARLEEDREQEEASDGSIPATSTTSKAIR